jgi:hypothetical protein
MQKIPLWRSRDCAYTVPTVIAAGMAGGTTMVSISQALMIISHIVA